MRQLLAGKRIAVTGGGGFIGWFVLRALLKHGASVRALMGPPRQATHPAPAAVLTLTSDITDRAAARLLVQGTDAVIHMAGPASVRESFTQADEYSRVHVSGTQTMLDACRAAGVKRFVYISSAEVYGQPETELVCEDHPLRPQSPYATAKSAAEKLVRAFTRSTVAQAAILRPFSIYGPGVSPQSVLGTILQQARGAECIELRDLAPIRDYCYVEDLAEAVVLSCHVRLEGGDVVNIGTGIGTSVGDLAKLVLAALRLDLPVCQIASNKRAVSKICRMVADRRRAKQLLGWIPATALDLGIQKTIQSFIA